MFIFVPHFNSMQIVNRNYALHVETFNKLMHTIIKNYAITL